MFFVRIIMLWIVPCAICFDLMSYSQKYKRWVGNAQIFKQKQRDRWHHGHVLWHWQWHGVQLSLLLIARKWVWQMCNLWSTETKKQGHVSQMSHHNWVLTNLAKAHIDWQYLVQLFLRCMHSTTWNVQLLHSHHSGNEAVRNMVGYCHRHCPPSVMRMKKIFH